MTARLSKEFLKSMNFTTTPKYNTKNANERSSVQTSWKTVGKYLDKAIAKNGKSK